MLLFIPRSLCALKRVAAKTDQARFGATQGIRIAVVSGLYRAEATDGRRAIVVQGMVPNEEPPWPGLKDLPDDAFEAIILPKDLERACKVGEAFLQTRFGVFGMATMGNDVCLGLGSELVTARTVEGKFPNIANVIPKKRPMFTFRVDPKILAETLLAIADLLPDGAQGVQCFYYGDGLPLAFCAQNPENGIMIDALVVPLTTPKPDAKDKPSPEEGEAGRKRKKAEPEANGQGEETPAAEATPTAEAPPVQEPDATSVEPPAKKSRKAS